MQGHQSFQKAVAEFKVRCRRVRTFCIEEGGEEQLATSYNKTYRLKPLGIVNKHPAIKGMPVLEEEDARMTTQAILAMRGVNQRKQKEMHEEGSLKLQERTLAYKGTSTAWMRSLDLGQKENWTCEPALPDGPVANKLTLRCISCPKCGHEKNVEKYKVYGRVGFSRITCMRCKVTTTAQEWRCRCKLPWPKCEVHTLKTLMHAISRCNAQHGGSKIIKKGLKNLQGQDVAYPQRRSQGSAIAAESSDLSHGPPRTTLKAGSLLAKRFPRLYDLQPKEVAK